MPAPFSTLLSKLTSATPFARPTPSPSPDSLTATQPSPSATSSSTLFTKIPSEICQKILREAFGDRTIHLYLKFGHPPRTKRTLPPQNRRFPLPFKSTRKRWFWIGLVCYRSGYLQGGHGHPSPVPVPTNVRPPRLFGPSSEAHDDKCLWWFLLAESEAKFFKDMARKYEDKFWDGVARWHSVGAGGWLRACRRAYLEGREVLYGSNVFHVAGKEAVLNLGGMLSMGSLAMVKRVELVWEKLRPWKEDKRERGGGLRSINGMRAVRSGMQGFDDLLGAVPRTFPNLEELRIAMSGEIKDWEALGIDQTMKWQNETFLGHIDDAVAKMFCEHRLVDCRVAVPSDFFGMVVPSRGSGGREIAIGGVWRDISVVKNTLSLLGEDGETVLSQTWNKARGGGDQSKIGYWLLRGT